MYCFRTLQIFKRSFKVTYTLMHQRIMIMQLQNVFMYTIHYHIVITAVNPSNNKFNMWHSKMRRRKYNFIGICHIPVWNERIQKLNFTGCTLAATIWLSFPFNLSFLENLEYKGASQCVKKVYLQTISNHIKESPVIPYLFPDIKGTFQHVLSTNHLRTDLQLQANKAY